MHSLPVLQFGSDAIDACAAGNCTHCGLCCTTMTVTVPSERGDIDSAPIHKKAGEVCPQLIADARGRYLCALHDAKAAGDPRLQDCAAWNGRGNGALQIRLRAEEWIKNPPDRDAALMLNDLAHRGLYSGIGVELDDDQLLRVVEHYIVKLHCVPQHVFSVLDVRSRIRELFRNDRIGYESFDRLLWTQAPDLYSDFFHDYIWNGLSPHELMQSVRKAYSTP